ncbi:DUF4332 domain-containing protein [Maribellus comscasis]|uniref:DUF4332 domain-containing protein n=1 Tax=Maribellus comscasis TaxID=2681766 RepID=A0A6I6JLW7_9BACT|nr:DUF4332 domain-containing protein [Maribellus comscasis]QGY42209.1 DUF4332 domain-containing protein [Maribellus comscasis]
MGYYINLQNVDLNKYMTILKSADLLPSRLVLKHDIDKHFERIKSSGVVNLEEYLERTKTKRKLQDFSKQYGVDENYLTILTREIKSYLKPPCKLKDFPGIPAKIVLTLKEKGLNNTLQFFEYGLTPAKRKKLSMETGVSEEWILKLARLTDLCRIRWVNHTFAFILMETGYGSAQNIAGANVSELHEKVNRFIEENGLFKVRIGLHDIKLCIEAAKNLSFDMIF